MRAKLPGGTVTFLFTDVEGSTSLLDELGAERYAEVLAEHRRLVRGIAASSGGVEVDNQGDAFFLAFPLAAGALAAAEGIRDALAQGRVRVRMGLHTGEPLLTDEGYVGPDVHRAARIAAAGHGGQVLLSAATASLVEGHLRDLGEHRFKDLAAAERLYQLGDEDFPALRSLHRTNLPVPSTAFLGRDRELGELKELLSRPHVRLVTLIGPGGIGKTRVALQTAALVSEDYPDGVWWVPLAAIRDAGVVEEVAAQALGAKEGLVEHIGSKRALVLFDNFEQVLEAASGIGDLLASCPDLKVLATSREPLHLSSEHEYAVAPLGRDDGIKLFNARAQAVRADFRSDAAVSEICRRLDDLPLALELAAARVKVLSPSQILERIGEALPLLADGPRDAPERQRTLRATIEWSHDLLSADEQQLFRRLAVFTGGFTLEAAEEVCDADLEAISLLVDKSLVRVSDERFSVLETIREYADERLSASGEENDLRTRHARFFATFAEGVEPELTSGGRQALWLERIAQDHENLRSALAWLSDAGERESVLRVSGSLVVFWFVRGFYAEGVDWLCRAIAEAEVSSSALAKALWGAGFLEALEGDFATGKAHLDRSIAVGREVGDDSSVARSLLGLGLLAFFENDIPQARAMMEQSVEIARTTDDVWCLTDGLGTLSSIYPLQGDLAPAQLVGEEALRLARRGPDQQGIRMALFGLALTAVRRGDTTAARSLGTEGLAICREIGDPWFTSYFLWILAMAARAQGEPGLAHAEADEAVAVAREIGGGALLLVCALEVQAALDLDDGNTVEAGRRLDEALAVGESGVPKSYLAAVRLTRARLAHQEADLDGAQREIQLSLALARECGDTWAADAAHAASVELAVTAPHDEP